MDEKEYDLLMKDLCGRLPYGVKANVSGWDDYRQEEVNIPLRVYSIDTDGYLHFESNDYDVIGIEHCVLFLRPLSSMTDKEREEYSEFIAEINGCAYFIDPISQMDWLNKNMFDYRGLIPKGLALEAPKGMYNN